jgi:NADPH:quinone reductase-like Zn-dependent oxidoreductase
VVLNSLAGDALSATWECIARFGRFVEMGKKDFIDNRRLEMSTFLRNVTFASIDLITVFSYNPRLAGQLLTEAVDMISAKSLVPIPCITTFTFSQFEEAFRHMQAGKHVGKVVMVPQKDDIVKVSWPFAVPIINHLANKC